MNAYGTTPNALKAKAFRLALRCSGAGFSQECERDLALLICVVCHANRIRIDLPFEFHKTVKKSRFYGITHFTAYSAEIDSEKRKIGAHYGYPY